MPTPAAVHPSGIEAQLVRHAVELEPLGAPETQSVSTTHRVTSRPEIELPAAVKRTFTWNPVRDGLLSQGPGGGGVPAFR